MTSFQMGDLTAVVRYGSPVTFARAGAVAAPHTNWHFHSDRIVGNRSGVVSELKRGGYRADWLQLAPQGTVTLEPGIGRSA
jgi:hypothetical protein